MAYGRFTITDGDYARESSNSNKREEDLVNFEGDIITMSSGNPYGGNYYILYDRCITQKCNVYE